MNELMKWLAKNGRKITKVIGEGGKKAGDFAEVAGKTALGGASLGVKGAGKKIAENPKKAAALAAAAGYYAGDDDDEDDLPKKKKKRPYAE